MKTNQQLCSIHKKAIDGICIEKICKHQSRVLCNDCHFMHIKCAKRVKIGQFNHTLQYILNPNLHKSSCTYFAQNSQLQAQIDDLFDEIKQNIKHTFLDLELKKLEQLLAQQGDTCWAQVLLNLKNNQLSKQEYDAAAFMYIEKQKFEDDSLNSVKLLASELKAQLLQKQTFLQETYKLKDTHYDASKVYQKAMETLNKQYLQYEDIIENIKGRRFKALHGHREDSAIMSIIETDSLIITGSDDGLIVGWFRSKPDYLLDYRIQTNAGLSSLASAKVQDQLYLFVGGQGSIQAFSLKTKQKLFAFSGVKSQINKLKAYSLQYLISASQDGQVRIWDILERKSIKSFQNHTGPVSDFVIDEDLITVGQDGNLCLIDINSQVVKKTLKYPAPIFSIAIVKRGKYAVALGNGNIRIVKGATRKDIHICDEVIWKYKYNLRLGYWL